DIRGVRWAHRRGLVGDPRGLGSLSLHRVCVSGSSRRSWTLRFQTPGAVRARFVSPRGPGVVSPPVTGFLEGALMSPTPRTPRRPPPFHPEASVDLETSLRKGIGI